MKKYDAVGKPPQTEQQDKEAEKVDIDFEALMDEYDEAAMGEEQRENLYLERRYRIRRQVLEYMEAAKICQKYKAGLAVAMSTAQP